MRKRSEYRYGKTYKTILAIPVMVAALATLLHCSPVGGTPSATPIQEISALAGDNFMVSSGQEYFESADFIGSEECRACHQTEYNEWRQSWHSRMEQLPNSETVVADFGGRVIQYDPVAVTTSDGQPEEISPSIHVYAEDERYFFTLLDRDDPANNQTYEIAKVLGGKWDQQYEVQISEDHYLPSPARWSVAAMDWLVSSYRPQDWFMADGTTDGRPRQPTQLPLDRTAEAKCSGCHTTGFEFFRDEVTNNWRARGKGELGVGCEHCHGPGGNHIKITEDIYERDEPLALNELGIVNPLRNLSPLQQTQLCAQCHGRATNKAEPDLAFQLGFRPGDTDITSRLRFWSYSGSSNPAEFNAFYPNDWARRNRQQWQDFTKSAHFNQAGMSCLSCHAGHGTQHDAQLRQSSVEICTNCHTRTGQAKRPNVEFYEGSRMQQAGVTCVDCHMPKIGVRSTKTQSGPAQWDTSSHTFLMATPGLQRSIGVRSACANCHLDEGEPKLMPSGSEVTLYSNDELQILLNGTQGLVRQRINEVQRLIAEVPLESPDSSAAAGRAQERVNFVLLDGSFGFHNRSKALALLQEAEAVVRTPASQD